MTKGRLAETIIEEMFIASGYEVHRFGMENMVPGLVRRLNNNNSNVSSHIKKMPDFVMKKGGEVHFVEVKFRGDGKFDIDKLQRDNKTYPYADCILIVVSPEKIKSLSVKDLNDKMEITPQCKNYLGNRKEFDLEKKVISDYLEIVKVFFQHLPPKID